MNSIGETLPELEQTRRLNPLPRRSLLRLGAMWALVSVGAAGCGGGSPVAVLPGGGGTGDIPPPPPPSTPSTPTPAGAVPVAGGAYGALTALQPAQLNGMSWPLAAAVNVLIDDVEESSLQIGMIARLTGGLDAGGASGLANEVLVRPSLRGPLSGLDAQGFTVNGVRVNLAATTQWAAGAVLSALRNGDVVQVHGHIHPVGATGAQLLATRVLRTTQRASLGIALGIQRPSLGSVANSLTINGLAFGTASALLANGAAAAPRDGALVHVVFEVQSDGSRRATQLAPVLPSLLADSTVRIQGFAYADGVSTDLRIADVPLDLPSAISRSSVEGRLVIASGLYRQGRLQVTALV